MSDAFFRTLLVNDARVLIAAMLVCAQENNVKGVAELSIQLGVVLSQIDNAILTRKEQNNDK